VTDVLFFHTPDGGEIDLVNGQVRLTNGDEGFVYLALFGGNADDSGDEVDKPKQWWGNVNETDPARQYRSEFQYLLRTLPLVSGNLVLFEEAAERDLARAYNGIAKLVSARCSIPAPRRIRVEINVERDGEVRAFEITEEWGDTP
jgi:hypothetical protein